MIESNELKKIVLENINKEGGEDENQNISRGGNEDRICKLIEEQAFKIGYFTRRFRQEDIFTNNPIPKVKINLYNLEIECNTFYQLYLIALRLNLQSIEPLTRTAFYITNFSNEYEYGVNIFLHYIIADNDVSNAILNGYSIQSVYIIYNDVECVFSILMKKEKEYMHKFINRKIDIYFMTLRDKYGYKSNLSLR